jgi:hypothetical protein
VDAIYQREMLAFREKISLAEIEVAKAVVRARELRYAMARYAMEHHLLAAKEAEHGRPA